MAYRIEFTPRAERDFKSLDGSVRGRIRQRIDALAENPFPSGIKKLEGEDELYRLRVGDYRILYQVQRKILLVLIVRIGHRREIYRQWAARSARWLRGGYGPQVSTSARQEWRRSSKIVQGQRG